MNDISPATDRVNTITPLGAAGGVTGSAYLLTTEKNKILIDFGIFQGSPTAFRRNRVPSLLQVKELDAVLLTHAHLDHSGRLPLLVKEGFRGPVYATAATIEMVRLILMDAARLQEADSESENLRLIRAGLAPRPPLFTSADVAKLLELFRPVEYGVNVEVARGVKALWSDAGHILGSANIHVTLQIAGRETEVLFSGDIGQKGAPFLADPARVQHANLVFVESTYGDRNHRPLDKTLEELSGIIQGAYDARGRVLIPAFAVGRTQDLLFHFARLQMERRIPVMPIFVDSPMALESLRIYFDYKQLFDNETRALIESGALKENLRNVQMCRTVEDSKRLNTLPGPFIVIAGSGMCTGGRIVHHLRNHVWKNDTTVLFAGFQSQGTLGRRIVDGQRRISIRGIPVAVNAQVRTLGGFSAHADQSGLLKWLTPLAPRRPLVQLVHGEDNARTALKAAIEKTLGLSVQLPYEGVAIPLQLD